MIVLNAYRENHQRAHDLLQVGTNYVVFAKVIGEFGVITPPWRVEFIPTEDQEKNIVSELLKLKTSEEPSAYERFAKGCINLVRSAKELKPELFASYV